MLVSGRVKCCFSSETQILIHLSMVIELLIILAICSIRNPALNSSINQNLHELVVSNRNTLKLTDIAHEKSPSFPLNSWFSYHPKWWDFPASYVSLQGVYLGDSRIQDPPRVGSNSTRRMVSSFITAGKLGRKRE